MNEQQYRYATPKFPAANATCWYCDHQLGDGRRFCDRGCAEAFEHDDLAVERRLLARKPDLTLVNA
ncbi:hypothetical protein [Janthinobacterium sp. 17J80-10]|uniref:hypothetical protein n=1 Tax=Janthinobacterium sp. 17J80-10 TaxID=2497863 RepID=UPI0010057719|nr:hypothetical protein [Janthinobacterium sp. 17J80-10]QAU35175.1 hypothetical protein EKL02_13870 [Janthinobacterium sp. 17J80-10]